jgi:signal transduction histidine kinase
MPAQHSQFPRLVSLACHDLRTPLATVHGFARTLSRTGDLAEPATRYVEMIEAASSQLADLLDELALVARIEGGRWEPNVQPTDSLDLASEAAERVTAGAVAVDGEGTEVAVDVEAAEHAVAAFATCAIRHGGLEHLELAVDGTELRLSPIPEEAAPIVMGESLRDLGAAVAVRAIRALGGEVELDGETLRVRLPT